MQPTNDKPSRNEQEYFARLDQEALAALRRQNDAERARAERSSHHMRCPKCGGTLAEAEMAHVKIDRCGDCDGIWLDKGELQILAKHLEAHESGNPVSRFLGDLFDLRAK